MGACPVEEYPVLSNVTSDIDDGVGERNLMRHRICVQYKEKTT
jgi:hypothetical protein